MNIQPTPEEAQIYPYLDPADQELYQQKMMWDRKPKPAIDYLMFSITYKCNARCQMCRIWEHEPVEEMTVDEYRTLVQDPLVKNVGRADFTGGEPFIRKDFLNIVKAVIETIPIQSITIPTNGWYSDKVMGFYYKLRQTYKGWLHIGLSIDGAKKTHDAIRGKGFFRRAMETYGGLSLRRKEDPMLGTGIKATIIGDENIDDVIRMTEEFGTAVKFALAINCENNENMDVRFPYSEELLSKYDNLLRDHPWDFGPLTEFINMKMKKRPESVNIPCIECLDKSIYIKPEGDVYGCVYSRDEHFLGNLRDYDMSLTDLVNRNYSRVIKARDKCSGCIADCYYRSNVALTNPYYEWKSRKRAIGW